MSMILIREVDRMTISFSASDQDFNVITFMPTENQVMLLLCFDLQFLLVIMRMSEFHCGL